MRNILLTLFNLAFLFCALLLGGKFFMGEFLSSHKKVPPAKPAPAVSARRTPGTEGLKYAKLVSIPASVYKGIKANPAYKEYLLGNKKYVVQIMSPACPYARALRGRVWQLLRGEYGDYYDEGVIKVQGSVELSCNGAENCPAFWIFEHCSGLCLINPNTRQAVVYSSRETQPVEALLERFKNW